jgi:hypothetical protein
MPVVPPVSKMLKGGLGIFWHPDFRLQIAQPFVLKMREAQARRSHLLRRRDSSRLFGPIQPERRSRFPARNATAHFANVGVEFFLGGLDVFGINGHIGMRFLKTEKYLSIVVLDGGLVSSEKMTMQRGGANHHRKDGHVTVQETDIPVGCAGENFGRIHALTNFQMMSSFGLAAAAGRQFPAWPRPC